MPIGNEGASTGHKCPKCGGTIVYNGNFFCERWEDACSWTLPHPQTTLEDRKISYALNGYWEPGDRMVDGEYVYVLVYEEPTDGK